MPSRTASQSSSCSELSVKELPALPTQPRVWGFLTHFPTFPGAPKMPNEFHFLGWHVTSSCGASGQELWKARKLGKHSLGLQREEERECMTLIQHGLSGEIYYYYRCYFSLNFNFTFYHPDDNFILGRYNVGKEKKEYCSSIHQQGITCYILCKKTKMVRKQRWKSYSFCPWGVYSLMNYIW